MFHPTVRPLSKIAQQCLRQFSGFGDAHFWAPEEESTNTRLESATWLFRKKLAEHSQGCYLVCNNLILVLLIRTMETVLIFIVGLQVLPSITPVLTVNFGHQLQAPARRKKDNTHFPIVSKFLRICNCSATPLSKIVRIYYYEIGPKRRWLAGKCLFFTFFKRSLQQNIVETVCRKFVCAFRRPLWQSQSASL